MKGERRAEQRPETERGIEHPERIIAHRLLTRELPLDVHVRVVMRHGFRAAVHVQSVLLRSVAEQQPRQRRHDHDGGNAHNNPRTVIAVVLFEPLDQLGRKREGE